MPDFDLVMQALTDTDAILATHFRAGPGAFLRVEPVLKTTRNSTRGWIHWRFYFMDYGMYHELSGKSRIVHANGTLLVDRCPARSGWQAVNLVFAGHYARFLRELHVELESLLL
jgi:hypothetical protein